MNTYELFVKPTLDFFVAFFALALTLPIQVLLYILLSISNRGNAFFRQERAGRNARAFKIIKFKTMNDKRNSEGILLPDENRLTIVGAFIRKTSLDELPQLFNVLAGKMSIVGPRPLPLEYLPIYSIEQKKRHQVKPGITGWAQINGRNSISWKQKFEYDIWYVNNISFWTDFRIILLTIIKVFRAEGISGKGVATAEKFNGNN